MIKTILLIAVTLALAVPADAAGRTTPPRSRKSVFRVATFNNQYDNRNVEAGKWENRLDAVRRLFTDQRFDIVGMQEPFSHQMADMERMLGDRYAWVGCNVLDDDTRTGIHYNPIFYLKERFEVLEWGRFWFSERPDEAGSKSWDSYSPRMCVWAKFRERRTGKVFYHFNSHFDHRGQTARERSAELLLRKVAETAGDVPAFCTGDFNSTQENAAYRIITGGARLVDSYDAAKRRSNGDIPSYNGYAQPPRRTDGKAPDLDHVFVTPDTEVLSWHLVPDAYDGRYPSDHFPIVIEWRVPKR